MTTIDRLPSLPGVKTGRIVHRDDGGKGPATEIVVCLSHIVPEMFREDFATGTGAAGAGGTEPVPV